MYLNFYKKAKLKTHFLSKKFSGFLLFANFFNKYQLFRS